MIKTILLSGLWMFILPIILGLGILKFDSKKNKSIFLALVLGIFVELLVFEAISIPMTFKRCSFTMLKETWMTVIAVLSVISFIFNIKNAKEIVKQNFEAIKTVPKILTVLFLVLLVIQCYYPFKYTHLDFDDSNFVAKAVIARDTDTLFVYDDAGNEYKEFPTRQVLSQFPHFIAVLSEISSIHPTIFAHTVLPVIFILIIYAFYYVFGMTLFKKDQTKALCFLIILSTVFIYGDYSRYTNFSRLTYRLWQGKSILANLTLPFIWYVFIEYIGKENSKFGWFILFIALAGSIALSSMALILPTITILVLMVIYAIKDKKIIYVISILICCIPCAIFASIYFKLDNPVVKNSSLLDEEVSLEEKIDDVFEGSESEKVAHELQLSFERAGGRAYYMPLFAASMAFAWVVCKRERKDILAIFTVFSLIVFLINANPVFGQLWDMAFGLGVHWRMYWLLPIGYSIAFMLTELVFKTDGTVGKIITMTLCLLVITFSGSNVYKNGNFWLTGNYFKIPDYELEIIFEVSSDENDYKKIAGSEGIYVYTRCVDGNIILDQQRNVGGHYSANSLIKLIEKGEFEKVYKQAIKNKCNYIAVEKQYIKPDSKTLDDFGFEILHENDKLILYKIDLEEVELKEEVKKK